MALCLCIWLACHGEINLGLTCCTAASGDWGGGVGKVTSACCVFTALDAAVDSVVACAIFLAVASAAACSSMILARASSCAAQCPEFFALRSSEARTASISGIQRNNYTPGVPANVGAASDTRRRLGSRVAVPGAVSSKNATHTKQKNGAA